MLSVLQYPFRGGKNHTLVEFQKNLPIHLLNKEWTMRFFAQECARFPALCLPIWRYANKALGMVFALQIVQAYLDLQEV